LCDLFVTHGWAEGLYEFVDKVTASWPRGATAAYCCMLANPQTLDIGALLASPSSSPFARALRSAKTVLVVPNRRGSIYGRLWCVYEAFLACSLDKEIYVATPPLGRDVCTALGRLAAAGLVAGAVLAWLSAWLDPETSDLDLAPLNAAVCLLCTQLRTPRLKAVATRLGAATASWLFVASLHDGPLLAGAVWLAVPVASEHQRFVDARVDQEAALLAVWSVRDASCSEPRDELNLRAAISDWAAVERAVAVLRRAGMSTASLRDAAAAGVDVRDAGRVNVAGLCFNLCFWLWSARLFATLPYSQYHLLDAGCAVVWAVAWLALRRRDQRAFAASALAFFTVCRLPLVVAGCTVLAGYRHRYLRLAVTERLAGQLLPWSLALSALQLVTLAVPLGSLARVPAIGPLAARVLLFKWRRGDS
jgi:hypothetical protein